jgi:hypothetical protein
MTMTKFEDQLFTDLINEYQPALQSTRRPAAKGRHEVPRRVWLAVGAGGVAGVATAGVVLFGGGSPAYAVTPNANGSVTVSVTKLAGVAGANARLQALDLEVALVPVEPGCPALSSLPKANWPPEARTGETAKTADGTVTVGVRDIPPGDTALVPVRTLSNSVIYFTVHLIKGPAPSCVSLPGGGAVH